MIFSLIYRNILWKYMEKKDMNKVNIQDLS